MQISASILLVAIAADSFAVQHHVRPRLSEQLVFNDNRRLVSSNARTVYGSSTDVSVATLFGNKTTTVLITPRVRVERYEGDSDLNKEDYFLDLESVKTLGNVRLNLAAGFSDVSTLTTDFDAIELFSVNKSRLSKSVSTRLSYLRSARMVIALGAAFADVDFEDSERNQFDDYKIYSAFIESRYQWHQRLTGFASFTVGEFRVTDTGSRSTNFSARIGAELLFSESLSMDASVGTIDSSVVVNNVLMELDPVTGVAFETSSTKIDTTDLLAAVELQKEFATWNLRLLHTRSVIPGSVGSQIKNNLSQGIVRWDIRPDTVAVFQIGYSNRRSQAQLDIDQDQDTIVFSTTIARRVFKNWSLELGYQYRNLERKSVSTNANFNQIHFTVRFYGDEAPFPSLL